MWELQCCQRCCCSQPDWTGRIPIFSAAELKHCWVKLRGAVRGLCVVLGMGKEAKVSNAAAWAWTVDCIWGEMLNSCEKGAMEACVTETASRQSETMQNRAERGAQRQPGDLGKHTSCIPSWSMLWSALLVLGLSAHPSFVRLGSGIRDVFGPFLSYLNGSSGPLSELQERSAGAEHSCLLLLGNILQLY